MYLEKISYHDLITVFEITFSYINMENTTRDFANELVEYKFSRGEKDFELLLLNYFKLLYKIYNCLDSKDTINNYFVFEFFYKTYSAINKGIVKHYILKELYYILKYIMQENIYYLNYFIEHKMYVDFNFFNNFIEDFYMSLSDTESVELYLYTKENYHKKLFVNMRNFNTYLLLSYNLPSKILNLYVLKYFLNDCDILYPNFTFQFINKNFEVFFNRIAEFINKPLIEVKNCSFKKFHDNYEINIEAKSKLKYLVHNFNETRSVDDIKAFFDNPFYLLRWSIITNKFKLGSFLGKENNTGNLLLFLNTFNFTRYALLDALRYFLSTFVLPGEMQVIVRILKEFGIKYFDDRSEFCKKINLLNQKNIHEKNENNAVIESIPVLNNHEQELNILNHSKNDICLLIYALIMLNTTIHNPNVKQKKNRKSFVAELKKIKFYKEFDEKFVIGLYYNIKKNPIIFEKEQGFSVENYKLYIILKNELLNKTTHKNENIIIEKTVESNLHLSCTENVSNDHLKLNIEEINEIVETMSVSKPSVDNKEVGSKIKSISILNNDSNKNGFYNNQNIKNFIFYESTTCKTLPELGRNICNHCCHHAYKNLLQENYLSYIEKIILKSENNFDDIKKLIKLFKYFNIIDGLLYVYYALYVESDKIHFNIISDLFFEILNGLSDMENKESNLTKEWVKKYVHEKLITENHNFFKIPFDVMTEIINGFETESVFLQSKDKSLQDEFYKEVNRFIRNTSTINEYFYFYIVKENLKCSSSIKFVLHELILKNCYRIEFVFENDILNSFINDNLFINELIFKIIDLSYSKAFIKTIDFLYKKNYNLDQILLKIVIDYQEFVNDDVLDLYKSIIFDNDTKNNFIILLHLNKRYDFFEIICKPLLQSFSESKNLSDFNINNLKNKYFDVFLRDTQKLMTFYASSFSFLNYKIIAKYITQNFIESRKCPLLDTEFLKKFNDCFTYILLKDCIVDNKELHQYLLRITKIIEPLFIILLNYICNNKDVLDHLKGQTKKAITKTVIQSIKKSVYTETLCICNNEHDFIGLIDNLVAILEDKQYINKPDLLFYYQYKEKQVIKSDALQNKTIINEKDIDDTYLETKKNSETIHEENKVDIDLINNKNLDNEINKSNNSIVSNNEQKTENGYVCDNTNKKREESDIYEL
ncbi:GDP/GTP exchange factor for ARF [Conglomerata obtusa]